jgi:hypothetical protein
MRARSETPCIKSYYSALANIIIICFNYNKLGYFAFICLEPYKRNLKEIKEEKSDKLEEINKPRKKES